MKKESHVKVSSVIACSSDFSLFDFPRTGLTDDKIKCLASHFERSERQTVVSSGEGYVFTDGEETKIAFSDNCGEKTVISFRETEAEIRKDGTFKYDLFIKNGVISYFDHVNGICTIQGASLGTKLAAKCTENRITLFIEYYCELRGTDTHRIKMRIDASVRDTSEGGSCD